MRPEYVACVASRDGEVWCEREDVGFEFTFTGADHALRNTMNEGRLLTCPDCVKVICDVLEQGQLAGDS